MFGQTLTCWPVVKSKIHNKVLVFAQAPTSQTTTNNCYLLQHLQCQRALAGDDVRVVVRGNVDGTARRFLQSRNRFIARLLCWLAERHIRAVRLPHCVDFDLRARVWHHHRALDAELLSSGSQALACT